MDGWSLQRALAQVASAVCVLVLALAGTGVRPAPSWADGDPASDVLLAQDVFYPYQPKVSPTVEAALEKTLRAAASATGVHLKVALIGSPEELGLVPNFFGHPQAYANFLDREISFNRQQPLLVVMRAGFGAVPASLTSGVAGLAVDTRDGSNGLTRSAISAVVAFARSRGHPIAAPSFAVRSSGGSPPALLVFGLPAALLILAGVAVIRRGASRR
jgi:hypothetical protein